MTRNARRRGALLALFAGLALCSVRAVAHDPFEVTTLATIGEGSMTLVVTMTRSSAALVLGLDADPNDWPSREGDRFRGAAVAHRLYAVRSNGKELAHRSGRVELNAEGEVVFHLEYPHPPAGTFRLEALLLSALSEGHGNAVRLVQGRAGAVLAIEFLHASHRVLEAQLPPAPLGRTTAPANAPSASLPDLVTLGLHHILEGYDHLAFLAGLLLTCRRVRSMLGLVTCFTVAHSLTLALAALDRVPPAVGPWVEPLIGASVVCAGAHNVVAHGDPKHRFPLAFGFGLIHGLGFATALAELGLGGGGVPLVTSVLAFNVGVELGQLLIAAVAFPLLLGLWKLPHARAVVLAASVAIALAGAYWLVRSVASSPRLDPQPQAASALHPRSDSSECARLPEPSRRAHSSKSVPRKITVPPMSGPLKRPCPPMIRRS